MTWNYSHGHAKNLDGLCNIEGAKQREKISTFQMQKGQMALDAQLSVLCPGSCVLTFP